MKISCFGAGREVGRSAFLLQTDVNILLDHGIKLFGAKRGAAYPLPFQVSLDAVIISHAHLDHSGFLPYLYPHPVSFNWFATKQTVEISEVLWNDSMKIMGDELPYSRKEKDFALKAFVPIDYNQKVFIGKTSFYMTDAGHILGAGMTHLEHEKKRITYTGDFKIEETLLHKGAVPEKTDVLIIETTYSNREHPKRDEAEKTIIEKVKQTLEKGGSVLFPSFAVGRSQELIMLIRKYLPDVPLYLDGMARTITNIYSKNSYLLNDGEKFKEDLLSVNFIESSGQRRKAVSKPSVIISTAGMLQGGPALGYLFNINADSRIIFTGYNIEGTNGWNLLNHGKVEIDGNMLDVSLPVDYIDLSAHAGKTDLLDYIKKAQPSKIILNHGDNPQEFGQELREKGYDAVAPKIGDIIEVNI
ncbi:MBL fold metallo-hydrolase [Candidatus Micrarchaeota archaeon]|nr:MBL fold metallo-hydrolase [Candidatus Micrarchaeota archaeon]